MYEKRFDAVLNSLPSVTSFVEEYLEAIGCPMKAQTQIDIAIDELFSNIARYAYAPGTGTATVRLETAEDPRAVRITFIDRGVPYDPLVKEDPDTTLSAEERPIGGLGIMMVKRLMDGVTYEYRDGQNILTITKNL